MAVNDNAAARHGSDAMASIAARENRDTMVRLRAILVALPLLGAFFGWGIWYSITARPQQALDRDLVLAARANDLPGMQELLRQGASINATDDPAPVPFWYHWFGWSNPANVGGAYTVPSGRTALMCAASSYPEHPAMVKALLDRGADVNRRSATNDTALNAAARYGYAATVRLLVEHGADVNASDANGSTPLLQAVQMGNPATVQILLDHGARPGPYTPGGQSTALHLALQRHDQKMVSLLQRAGVK